MYVLIIVPNLTDVQVECPRSKLDFSHNGLSRLQRENSSGEPSCRSYGKCAPEYRQSALIMTPDEISGIEDILKSKAGKIFELVFDNQNLTVSQPLKDVS